MYVCVDTNTRENILPYNCKYPFKIALRLQQGHSLRESRGTPFASNVTVLRVEFSLLDSQKRALRIMLRPSTQIQVVYYFDLVEIIYEKATLLEMLRVQRENVVCPPTRLISYTVLKQTVTRNHSY